MALAAVNRVVQNAVVTASKVKYVPGYLFGRNLLVTNVTISMTLSAAGDGIEQYYEKFKSPERSYNPRRGFNMAVTGITVGFAGHFWYNWIDKFLPGRTIRIVLKKVLVDQLIGSPLYICTFFGTLAIVEQNSFEEFLDEFKEKCVQLYIAEWVVWTPAQLINFYFLPTRYRVLYDNTLSLFYDSYTSYLANEIQTKKKLERLNSMAARTIQDAELLCEDTGTDPQTNEFASAKEDL